MAIRLIRNSSSSYVIATDKCIIVGLGKGDNAFKVLKWAVREIIKR